MPEMVAPRALVFRPLVKGNKDPGNEIAKLLLQVFAPYCASEWLSKVPLQDFGCKNNENHKKLNDNDLTEAQDYQLGIRNSTGFLISIF